MPVVVFRTPKATMSITCYDIGKVILPNLMIAIYHWHPNSRYKTELLCFRENVLRKENADSRNMFQICYSMHRLEINIPFQISRFSS